MKFGKVGKLCKQSAYCELILVEPPVTLEDTVSSASSYVSTGNSIYPIPYDLPEIKTVEQLAAVFGWSAKDRKNVSMEVKHFDSVAEVHGLNLDDGVIDEVPCTELHMGIIYGGRNLLGLTDPKGGCGFVNRALSEPLRDEMASDDSYFNYSKRTTNDGTPYYVLKDGMNLRAVILPMSFKDGFYNDLDELYASASSVRKAK